MLVNLVYKLKFMIYDGHGDLRKRCDEADSLLGCVCATWVICNLQVSVFCGERTLSTPQIGYWNPLYSGKQGHFFFSPSSRRKKCHTKWDKRWMQGKSKQFSTSSWNLLSAQMQLQFKFWYGQFDNNYPGWCSFNVCCFSSETIYWKISQKRK